MRKKKCIGFIILLLVLLLGLSSNIYAFDSDELKSNLKKLSEGGILGEYFNYSQINLGNLPNYTNYAIVVGQGSKNENFSQPAKLSTTRQLYILATNNSSFSNYTNATNNYFYYYWNAADSIYYNVSTGTRVNNSWSAPLNDMITPYYVYTTCPINTRIIQLGAGEEYGGSFLTASINFEYALGASNVSVDGFNAAFKQLNYDYSLSYWTLGKIIGLNDFEKLHFQLWKIDTPTNQNVILDSYLTNIGNNYWVTDNSNLGINNVDDYKISVTSRLLNYQPYYMILYALDNNYNVLDSCEAYFVFRQTGSSVPAIIGSGDYVGSGDYNIQNSTNDILDGPNDNTDNLIALPAIEFDFNIGDESGDFFTWVLTEFVRVINTNENISIDIPIYNTHNLVPSNFWVLDIEPLRTFISAGWWFIVGVPFLKYIRSIIMHVRGGEIPVSDDKSDLLGNIL